MSLLNNCPLVSVIIPTYNYARFISRAIESVLSQTYPHFEVLVIDDGSKDNTAEIIRRFENVKYQYKTNGGLAAARNSGIGKSRGDYLVFLDADDWLEKGALENNIRMLHQHPNAAFVSGNHYFLKALTGELFEVRSEGIKDHYVELLKRNYIGMHATVMFRRSVLEKFKYDETLASCEDYDLYLRIAREYEIVHHDEMIATYYFHGAGLSHNYKVMQRTVDQVMRKQIPLIRTKQEEDALAIGLEQWKMYESETVEL